MPKRKGAAEAPLPEAPVFHPTEQEFSNPMRYLMSVREQSEKFGICCIVPPPSWKPPFMINLNQLKFPTRVQKINELLVRKVQRLKFMKELTEHWDAAGTPLSKLPQVGGKDLDLHLLHMHVERAGGIEQVTAKRKWAEVAESMNIHSATASTLPATLKKHYQQILLPFVRVKKGLDPPPKRAASPGKPAASASAAAASAPPAGAAMDTDGAPPADGAPPEATEHQSAGGGLMARRGGASMSELVKLNAGETSNAYEEEEVIAYEPPPPGEELCEVRAIATDDT